jgi:predicted DNA-binding transcriptional regulator YafY
MLDVVMGKRSGTASVAAVLAAFLTRRSWWSQADLARRVQVRPEAIRKLLADLVDSGLPLESKKEHPHVYWRMPKDWYPGGILFKAEHVPDLLRQLGHAPKSKARDRLLDIAMSQLPAKGKLTATAPVVTRAASENEEQYGPTIEDAAAKKVAVAMKYLTASRGGKVTDRHVSVHAIEIGPPARFIATCHRQGDLRWFRVDGIMRARPDDREAFRPCAIERVEAFRRSSLDGFKGEGAPLACSFFVREPEASWVANNLLEGMTADVQRGGIRVSLDTSAVLRLARFVAGLGAAARPETAALAEAVAELARGALQQAESFLADVATAGEGATDARADPARPPSDV